MAAAEFRACAFRWVFVLGLSVAACSGSGDGSGGTGGLGGAGGTGGLGGTGGTDLAPCESNLAVYDALEYTDGGGNRWSTFAAALAISHECVLGASASIPMNPGCDAEALSVWTCSRDCPLETVQALSDCIVGCTQEVVEEATGMTLTEECADCYGRGASCSIASCAIAGCFEDSYSPACIRCRCEEDCTPGFEQCSGLPPSGDCG